MLHEAHDIDRESHGYQPVSGPIRVLRELFGWSNSSSNNDIVSSSKGGASRISKQMWRWGVVLLFLFAMAVVGVMELSRIGGSHEESTRFLHHRSRHPEMLSLKEEEEEVNLTSLRMSMRKKSQHMVCQVVEVYNLSFTSLFFLLFYNIWYILLCVCMNCVVCVVCNTP